MRICCEKNIFRGFDENGNHTFKIIMYNFDSLTIKILDCDGNDIDISNKTLFNNGFSKIQIIHILRVLFYHLPRH